MPCGAQGVKGFDDDDDYDDDYVNCTVNIQMISFFRQPNIANSIQIKICKYFFPNATTCPLWTSWSSLLGMAGVKSTSVVGTPMRRSYFFPMVCES